MGLFTGLSLLSMVEVVYWIYRGIYDLIVEKLKNNAR